MHCGQQFLAALTALGTGHLGNGHGQFDVVPNVEIGDQVAGGGLPDEAHLLAAVDDQFPVGDVQQVPVAHPNLTRRRAFQAGQNVEQGGLAAAAGANDGRNLAGGHLQVDAPQGHYFQVGQLEYLEQVPALHVGKRVTVGADGYRRGSRLGSGTSLCFGGHCYVLPFGFLFWQL